jgi:hypothetical protein
MKINISLLSLKGRPCIYKISIGEKFYIGRSECVGDRIIQHIKVIAKILCNKQLDSRELVRYAKFYSADFSLGVSFELVAVFDSVRSATVFEGLMLKKYANSNDLLNTRADASGGRLKK